MRTPLDGARGSLAGRRLGASRARGPRGRRDRFTTPVDERKTYLIADGMKAPDLADVDLIVLAQPPCDIDHAGRDVEVKRHAQLPKVRPLCQRLQMIDRLPRFDLDDGLKTMPALRRLQDQVRVHDRRTAADPCVLLASGVDPGFVAASALGLQQANHTVVLELLTDRPHEDRAHVGASN